MVGINGSWSEVCARVGPTLLPSDELNYYLHPCRVGQNHAELTYVGSRADTPV